MIDPIISAELGKLYFPSPSSHKGQNGRLLIIGGSRLFHAASLWALKVASRIVDLVHYSSTEENNKIVQRLKEEFRDGIVVPRSEIEEYIEEDDCILIGPGMLRMKNETMKQCNNLPVRQAGVTMNLKDIEKFENEGVQTYFLTKYLLQKYPHKKWVIDAGALQMLEPSFIPEGAILTPHKREFELLKSKIQNPNVKSNPKSKIQHDKLEEQVKLFAEQYNCVVLLKGKEDIIASKNQIKQIEGGNAGMTKGGTGDVLAGLVAALYCKNDAWTSAVAASFINKKAGEELFDKMGYWYNASDLADQIPETMRSLFIK